MHVCIFVFVCFSDFFFAYEICCNCCNCCVFKHVHTCLYIVYVVYRRRSNHHSLFPFHLKGMISCSNHHYLLFALQILLLLLLLQIVIVRESHYNYAICIRIIFYYFCCFCFFFIVQSLRPKLIHVLDDVCLLFVCLFCLHFPFLLCFSLLLHFTHTECFCILA